MVYWLFKYLIFRPVCVVAFRPRIEGEENIPRRGGAILASNHLSYGDTFLLPALIRRRLTFPAKAELFVPRKSLGSKLVAWFLTAVGQVPMDRSGGRASAEGLAPVVEALGQGRLVGIYPEGTRSPDGRLYKGKTGVARLSLITGVPIVPVGVERTEFVKGPLGIPIMRRPVIRIGKPLDFTRFGHRENDRDVIRWVTDEVMAAIQEITGQEYVNAYGVSVKSGQLGGEELLARIVPRPGLGAPEPSTDPS